MAMPLQLAPSVPLVPEGTGAEIHALAAELYPICRSITGDGVRETLRILSRHVPLEIHEVPSGTQAFDWTVPREWNISGAWVKDARGNTLIDFSASNLHVVNYSAPVHEWMSWEQLRPHLHTLPQHPDWVPYRTSYYKEDWGFCLAERDLKQFSGGKYEVFIGSSLKPGHLTYGEYFIQGETDREVLVSCHVCHPSLANDNLSGVSIAAHLARLLRGHTPRLSYRFLFIPGTIGSIVWLSRNEERAHRIAYGLVLTCVGDPGAFTYKKSRRGNAVIDRVMSHVLGHRVEGSRIVDFSPWGYDERQYCSPGFDLPVGCLMRTEHGQFPEYHTSADNLAFIRPKSLQGSFEACLEAFHILERDRTLLNLSPKCEPQLGRRGLYHSTGGSGIGSDNLATLWVLNLSDGKHSLLDIAERAALPFAVINTAAERLEQAGLVKEATCAG